jgi:hypothetical protein
VQLAAAVGWRHRRVLDANIDGDSGQERIVLASDVTVNADGRPLWEDGHRWALFVEDDGQRTLLYGAFVPNGSAEAGVLAPANGRRRLLIQERTPQLSQTYVVSYEGPGVAAGVSATSYQIEQWIAPLSD